MQVFELPVQVTIPGLLRAVEQLPAKDLEDFLAQARLIQKRNQNEGALLDVIYRQLPRLQHARLIQLSQKLEQETITETERKELLDLVEKTEAADVERAEALLALAQQREVSVSALMHDLRLEAKFD